MKCPHCRMGALTEVANTDGPLRFTCAQCHGLWLRANDYLVWQTNASWEPSSVELPEVTVCDSREAKLCPDCGRLLIRFKVHPDISFRLEHCGGCEGVWFDENEWEALAVRGLHLDLPGFFKPEWQQHLRRTDIRRHLEAQMRERFGEKDFERLRDVREWLASSDNRGEMLAFLTSDDPFH